MARPDTVKSIFVLLAAGVVASSASAADLKAGKTFFTDQCAVCHSAEPGDNGGAQGPLLNGVIGRASAGDKTFGYTKAMRNAKLVWDADTLDKFLTNPPAMVRGTAMVAIVPDKKDRDDLIAYFTSLQKTP